MTISFTALETYVTSHVASLEDSVKAEFAKFVEFVKGEEARIAAEIEHLTGKGYTVVAPQPDQPQAPSA